MIKLGDDMR
jgi:phosphatidylinositol 3-kinase